jgi:predicted ATPase/DNA-binding NarL/FixJ family response regulator
MVTPSTVRRSAGNLPADLTSFVGREREVAAVKQLLSTARLVTLTGVGGVGKTRLALRVAQDLRRAFPDGAWLVDLSGLDETGLLAQTVASSLGMRNESGRWPTAALADYLEDRRLLLVLDNCEHLLDACALLSNELLRRSGDLRMLATSRQPLGIDGEQVFAVPVLSAPDLQQPLPKPEALRDYEAVRLFVERGKAAVPGFAVTPENHVAVAQLCQRLDGLPLALELAAGRLRILSPEQIVSRLTDRYRLLTAGSRAARPRQQSLRALIDWSFDACTPGEQTLWSRLAVFPSDFDLDAVEEICSGDGLPRESILEALSGLADKSIVAAEDHPRQVRYRLLESIREYGRERLAGTGAAEGLRQRHRDYYRQLAAAAEADWFSPRQVEWMARLHAEHANLRAALDRCLLDPETAPAGLAMAASLDVHWLGIGSPAEGRRWLERGLALVTDARPERAKALWVASRLALNQGDIVAAESMLPESRALGEQIGDHHVVANATQYLGQAALLRGELEPASRLFEQALEQHRRLGDDSGIAFTLARLAMALSLSGDEERADTYYRESLATSEAKGELWCRAFALWNYSLVTFQRGDTRRAVDLARESLRIKREFDAHVGTAQCLEVLAWMATADGEHERAARLLGAVGSLWRDVGASLFEHLAHFHGECEAKTRRALGERAFVNAFRQGAKLPLEESVAYALGENAASDVAAGQDAAAALTRRELQIADLVATGLSNRDIAAMLVISQRTAEGHVEHILTKLGFTSRAQIAAWVTEQRAATPLR